MQRMVEREIDDRETTLAQDALDLELEKARALGERVGIGGNVATLDRRGIVVH